MYSSRQFQAKSHQSTSFVLLILQLITLSLSLPIQPAALRMPASLLHQDETNQSHQIVRTIDTDSLMTFLPIVLRTLPRFASSCGVSNSFCEPNNAPDSAFGPLAKSQPYSAFPEDSYDYYYLTLPVKGNLQVELFGYNAIGNLLIYRASDTTNPIANWGQGGSNMTLNLSNLDPGNYFILVYTSTGFNTSATYTLKATF